MAVVKDEKPLWRAGLALSGPVVVLSASALIIGAVNRQLLRSPTLRGLILILSALSILSLGMLLWRMRPGSRRLRRWDVRLSIVANVIVLVLAAVAIFVVRASNSNESDIGTPRSVIESGTP